MKHPHNDSLPFNLLAPQQRTKDAYIFRYVRPFQRERSHREASREAGSNSDHRALWSRHRQQSRNRACIDHWMAQTRHKHARSETDARRPLGGTTELYPDIRVESRGIVKPGPSVAELLGDPCVLGAFKGRCECTGDLYSHYHTSRLQPKPRQASIDVIF